MELRRIAARVIAPALALLVGCSGRVRSGDAGSPEGSDANGRDSKAQVTPADGRGCAALAPTPDHATMPCGLPEVRFTAGEDDLDALARCQLVAVAPCVAAQGELLILEAHASADEARGEEASLLLTERRGMAVRRVLVEHGLAPEMIQVIVKGNLESTGRANEADRRVELQLAGKPGPVDLCAADRDCDGVDLPADRCPEDHEFYNGVDDDDGCPDVGPFRIRLTARGHLVFDAPLLFKPGTATLDPASWPLLDALALVIRRNKHFSTVMIDVDVSGERGRRATLARLADDRRVAIEGALVDLGVPARTIPIRRGDELIRSVPRDPEDSGVMIRTARAPEVDRRGDCHCEYITFP